MFREKIFRSSILGILFSLAVFTSHQNAQNDGLLKVYFLDIGQGDSIFIEAPNGNQILIDGGPDNTVLQKLAQIMPFQDRDINIVILTHPHADHVTGLIEILNRYRISAVVQAKEIYDTPEFRAWGKEVPPKNGIEIEATAGKEFDLGSDVYLSVLYPLHSVAGTITKTPHDDMVVTQLRYKDTRILLTGDMEAPVEKFLAEHINLDADVLKVGHHGSKTSSSQLFLNTVTPQVAIISVGAKNRYHHPSPEVLNRLERNNIPYYRTDTDGDIKLISDGRHLLLSPY